MIICCDRTPKASFGTCRMAKKSGFAWQVKKSKKLNNTYPLENLSEGACEATFLYKKWIYFGYMDRIVIIGN